MPKSNTKRGLTPEEQFALMLTPEDAGAPEDVIDAIPITTKSQAIEPEPVDIEMPKGKVTDRVKKSERPQLVATAVHKEYDIIKVNHPETYWYKTKDVFTYRPLPESLILNWARDYYLSAFGVAEPRDIRATADMIKILTVNELDKIDREWIEIVENEAYWSKTLGEIKAQPDGPCFTRLFDTTAGSKHIVKIPAFSPKQRQTLWDTYNNTLAKLEDKSAFKEEPYEFISVWAKRNHDVYLDIVRSIAYCFVKKKPVGSYVLVGLRRNGKSSFVGLLHTIFGENNTSMLRLSQLGDNHVTYALTTTMLNAPDEEDEKAVDAQANFKTISDHGILNLPVMYRADAEPVICDFMSFYPMNHIPEWTGAGASACMKRTLVIPFYADLSKFDKSNYNFAEATFTADFMSGFIGYILAFANYYTSHELEFSDTMRAAQESIEEELDSAVIYRERFEEFFDGFSTVKLLFDDYCNWCKTKDMTIRPRKEFKFVFREYMTNRMYYSPEGSAYRYSVYRIPAPNHTPMFAEMPKTEAGDINFLHECGASLVERMEAYYQEKGWTPGGKE